MRGGTTVQVLQGFKTFAGAVPVVGDQLASLIELAVQLWRLIEEVETNQEMYMDLGNRVALLVSAIVADINEPSHHGKLDPHVFSMLDDLLKDLCQVKKTIEQHKLRDLKTYTGIGAGLRGNIRNIFTGLKHREDDQREVEVLKASVNSYIERFNVRAAIDSAASLKSIANKIEANHGTIESLRQEQVKMAEAQKKQASEQQRQALQADMHLIERKLATADSVQWSDFMDQTYCYPGTRVKLLEYLNSWAVEISAPSVLWISGLAGSGKSTLLRSFCADIHHSKRATLAGSFFISRKVVSQQDPRAVVQALAYGLALRDASVCRSVIMALKEPEDILKARLPEQVLKLVAVPLSQVAPRSTPILFVVDALDELDMGLRNREAQGLISLLTSAISQSSTHLKILVSSRRDSNLIATFERLTPPCKSIYLHDSDLVNVKSNLRLYLTKAMRSIEVDRSVPKPWPADQDLDKLVRLAGELFIFASTVVNFAALRPGNPLKHLQSILEPIKSEEGMLKDAYSMLDTLYDTALTGSLATATSSTTSVLRDATCMQFRQLVGSVILLKYPMTCGEISYLLNTDMHADKQLIQLLHAVFLWVEDQPIQILHPSFPEYLLSPIRCSEPRLRINTRQQHGYLTLRCLFMMNQYLQPVVSSSYRVGTLNSEIPDLEKHLAEKTTPALQYACKNWISHLSLASQDFEDTLEVGIQLRIFLTSKRVPAWLEVLSVLGALDSSFTGYNEVQNKIKQSGTHQDIHTSFQELYAAVGQFYAGLEASALEVHNSLPLFLPSCTLSAQIPPKSKANIKVTSARTQTHKMGALRVCYGHTSWVTSVAFSPDGTHIASGSGDSTVRIWDATTGTLQATLKGHTNSVSSVAFSPDGTRIISGSDDRTVRIWDVTTGTVQTTLEGHTQWVTSVAFSPDGKGIASSSDDHTVRIWNSSPGTIQAVLEGHTDWVSSVAFSSDGAYIASASRDHSVRIWDVITGAVQRTLEGHNQWVTSVAFSPDRKHIVSGSNDFTAKIWDLTTGTAHRTLEGHTSWVNSVAFSSSGTRIISCSDDCNVRIWDSTTGTVQAALEGHTHWVTSIASSPDGTRIASASRDHTVRIWNSTYSSDQTEPEGHTALVTSIAFSLDGKRVVSGSGDCTVRIWDSVTGAAEAVLEGHTSIVESVAVSPDGTRIVSGSGDYTVRIWDSKSGEARARLEGHTNGVTCVAFSPDGAHIASGSWDCTIRIWDTTTGAAQVTLEGHTKPVTSVGFSQQGAHITSIDMGNNTRTWDFRESIPGLRPSTHHAISRAVPFPVFSVEKGWLYAKTTSDMLDTRLCWIPENIRPYRSTSMAWSECIVALGSQTGLVTIINCSQALEQLLAGGDGAIV